MKLDQLLLLLIVVIAGMFVADRAIAVREKQQKAERVDRVIDIVEQVVLPAAAPRLTPEERDFVAALNTYRAQQGRVPLSPSGQLMRAARARAKVTNAFNVHFPGGEGVGATLSKFGYAWSACAENAAWEFPHNPPAEAVRSWKQSAGHNRAMLGPYTEVGLGVYEGTFRGQQGKWIIAIFARPQ